MLSVGVIAISLSTAAGLVSAAPARADLTAPLATGALASTTGVPASAGASTPKELGSEVVSMRTRFSRTYRQADRSLITRVSPEPVNFSTDGGQSWQAVDNRVVPVSEPDYAAKNAASDYDARLPRSLASPIRFAVGSRWVSFALGTDTPAPALSGDTATYSVSPDLTASYSLHGAGVREALSLAAASAPGVFRYHVDASAGLRPRLSAGGVLFVDETGRVRFGFSPPTVLDASGATGHAAFALGEDRTGWALTLSVDTAWLHDAARVFPVVVDPDVYWVSGSLRFSGATVDCHVDEAAASTSFCGTPWLYAGGTDGDQDTLLARFDLQDAIPSSAQVYGATFGLRMTDRTGATDPSMLEAHRVTVPWTDAATWSTSDGTQAWPAGFLDPVPAGPGITLGDPGWYGWDVTRVAQHWVSGETPNYGLALRDPTANPQTRYEFLSTDGEPSTAPYLDIAWIPAVGQIGHYTLLDVGSTATSHVRVNPGNGNVIVDSTDAPLAGFDEGLARSYNTLGGWFQWSSFGPGWIPHYGDGVAFVEFPGGIVGDTPDGAAPTFFANPDGTYTSTEPDYSSAEANADGSYTMHLSDGSQDGTSITASTYGWQQQQIQRGAASLAVSREDPDGVRTFTDGAGTVLTQHKDASNRIDSITNQATGRTATYEYRADGMLEAVHTPERDTTYTYAGFRDVITSIAESTGATLTLRYDDAGRVTSIRRSGNGDTTWTTFVYDEPSAPCNPSTDAGKTTVTGPDGVTIYCYDRTLHVTSRHVAPALERGQLGLEKYFAYDSTPTGVSTAAHVNVADGNLVWQSMPLVNPGRGLSSVVNLTYNAFDHGGYLGQLLGSDELPSIGGGLGTLQGVAYGEAGIGFSLGISGITRLNEPLAGVNALTDPGGTAQQIALTDADGTRHVFTRAAASPYPGTWYTSPPGVQLALRYQPASVTDPLKRWAATRPDGVTFYFDADGYQTLIQDRNGNTIRFEYERYSKVTGETADCDGTPAADLLCSERVARVVDPAGVDLAPNSPALPGTAAGARALHIRYKAGPVFPDPSGISPLSSLLGPVGGRAGRIEQITDHAGRTLNFSYDDDGYLTQLELRGDPDHGGDVRTFGFGYEGSGAGRQLATITDPRGNATSVSYDEDAPGILADGSVGRRAHSITNRRGNTTTFAYAGDTTTVTRPGGATTSYQTDDAGRPRTITNALGRQTALDWDARNNLTDYTEAADVASQAAHTHLTYDRLDNPKTVTDPNQHTTTLSYCYGTETAHTADCADHGTEYVSDLTRVQRPRGNGATLSVDDAGNVTALTYDGKPAATTHYPAQSHGLPDYELDELGNKTSYADYDANGLPHTITDPRGNASDPETSGVWRYDYDSVGNLLAVTDPRGSANAAGAPFTTSFTYDAFDRVKTSQTPKCTDPDPGVCPQTLWLNRSIAYDANGNPTATTDGNGNTTTRTYTAMDQLASETTPALPHAGESDPAGEETTWTYDARENVSSTTAPNGNATAADGDSTTTFAHDLLDELTTQTQQSRGGPSDPTNLVTSYAYDARGNVIGIADPRHNATGDPLTNATQAAGQRFAFEYDLADNRMAAVEDPSGLALRTQTAYDANDNVSDVTTPRGMQQTDPAERAKYTAHYDYDVHDDVIAVTQGGARTTAYGRRADGSVSSVTSPRGVASTDDDTDYVTKYDYDADGDIKQLTLPHAPGEPGSAATVAYARNPVGDPRTITDPRGHTITNTFFDTGDLRTTTRPSWWTVDFSGDGPEIRERTPDEWQTYDGSGIDLPTGPGDFGSVDAQPLPDVLPTAGDTTLGYDHEMRLTCVTDAAGSHTVLDRDAVGRVLGVIQPFVDDAPCGADPASQSSDVTVQQYGYDRDGNLRTAEDGRHFTTTTTYDQFDRWISRVAPGAAQSAPPTQPDAGPADLAGLAHDNTTTAAWDANGNQTTLVDPEHRTTTSGYDAADRLTRVIDNAGDVSDYGYDADGDPTCSRTPRGATDPASACGAGPYTTLSEYDEFGELSKVTRQAVFGAGTQDVVTSYGYDRDGNQTTVTAPGAERKPAVDEQPITTTRLFDGRDRVWHLQRGTAQSDDSDSKDVTRYVYQYDPMGNLRRVVDGRGLNTDGTATYGDDGVGAPTGNAGQHAKVFVTNADNLLTDTYLPWGTKDARDAYKYRQHFERDARGRVDWIDAPFDPAHDSAPDREDTSRTGYTHYLNGWIKTASDQHYAGDGHTGLVSDRTFSYAYDRQGNQTNWALGPSGSGRRVWRQYFPDGSLGRRVAFKNGSDTGRQYSYGYYGDGQLAELQDGDLNRTTDLAYDAAARLSHVNEKWKEDRDTQFDYDADGNIKHRWTDGALDTSQSDGYSGGKKATFTYDSLGREREATIAHTGEDDRTTQTSYWPSGDVRSITRPNRTQEDRYYDTQGRVRRRDRTPYGGSAQVQEYFYGEAGNRIRDDHGTDQYNARDELVEWTRKRDAGDPHDGHQVAWELNGSGGIVKRTELDGSLSVAYKLVGDQIDTADVTDHGVKTPFEYKYDGPGGEMTCAGATDGNTCANGVKYTYDAFGRMVAADDTTKPSANKPAYAYDGLDRRDWKCVNGTGDQCSGGTRTEYGYVGLTELVSSASRIGGGGTSFNYDYDSQGDRLGQDRVPSSGAHTFHSYFTDPNGTVIGLENADGQIPDGHTDQAGVYVDRAIYDFDPYGQEEDSEGSLSQDAQDNPYRFEGFELDSGVETYDMQARPYRPDLGRFTTPDRFEDSLGDFALQSDPLTQNRYAFGAGNPVNDIEFDGHCASSSGSTLYGPCRALPGTPKKTAQKVNRRADAAGRGIDQRNEAANREAQRTTQPTSTPQPTGEVYPTGTERIGPSDAQRARAFLASLWQGTGIPSLVEAGQHPPTNVSDAASEVAGAQCMIHEGFDPSMSAPCSTLRGALPNQQRFDLGHEATRGGMTVGALAAGPLAGLEGAGDAFDTIAAGLAARGRGLAARLADETGSVGPAAKGGGTTRVGRWMSREEHEAMEATGRVQEGAGGVTSVARPANPSAYERQAASGSRYVEFDVPTSSLRAGGRADWATIPGPRSIFHRQTGAYPEMPPATCISWLACRR